MLRNGVSKKKKTNWVARGAASAAAAADFMAGAAVAAEAPASSGSSSVAGADSVGQSGLGLVLGFVFTLGADSVGETGALSTLSAAPDTAVETPP